ncbi:hypothetical protein [Couchioplanes caeruleus]|uniref:Uncharacterized protein n=2 Tax=Couchioplanes caeruleus TaxID=56438 RepID=A0A1K0FP34_9ACTN|nr:hypothetical protein [Couchioplanes caeruleus]OJF14553.1 hypothetical protein BG844_09490 [Couchioplanes caeruleus subsp. caeruleus]ROP21286.1 hypothetical protein EDD30_7684 [Couchioplanes caeruleus]
MKHPEALASLTETVREPLNDEARIPIDEAIQRITSDEYEGEVPALDPPEFYRIDQTLIEVWDLPKYGPAVLEIVYTEVPGDRQAKKNGIFKYHDEMGADLDEWPSWHFEETNELVSVRAGYTSVDEARADARRLLLKLAINSPELRFFTGWGLDAVLVVRAQNWYTIRTKHNGTIEFWVDEEPLEAHGRYANKATQLAREVRNNFDIPVPPGMRKVAEAFIQREAANASLLQARQSLRIILESIDRHDTDADKKMNIAELARNLYTDRANLYKLMPSRQGNRRR